MYAGRLLARLSGLKRKRAEVKIFAPSYCTLRSTKFPLGKSFNDVGTNKGKVSTPYPEIEPNIRVCRGCIPCAPIFQNVFSGLIFIDFKRDSELSQEIRYLPDSFGRPQPEIRSRSYWNRIPGPPMCRIGGGRGQPHRGVQISRILHHPCTSVSYSSRIKSRLLM